MEVTIIINIVVMEIIITILVVPILIAKVQPVPNLGGINQPHHLGKCQFHENLHENLFHGFFNFFKGDVNLLPRAVNAITIITTIIITVY